MSARFAATAAEAPCRRAGRAPRWRPRAGGPARRGPAPRRADAESSTFPGARRSTRGASRRTCPGAPSWIDPKTPQRVARALISGARKWMPTSPRDLKVKQSPQARAWANGCRCQRDGEAENAGRRSDPVFSVLAVIAVSPDRGTRDSSPAPAGWRTDTAEPRRNSHCQAGEHREKNRTP